MLRVAIVACSAACACASFVTTGCSCEKEKLAAKDDDAGDAGAWSNSSVAPSASAPVILEPTTSRLTPPVAAYAGPCPGDMAQVGAFCIDRYEAPNAPNEYPLVMESAITAEAWCNKRGKRLCGEDEWERACAGPRGFQFPYGDAHEDARCADEKPWIVKDEPTITMWPEKPAMGEVTRLYQAEKSGTRASCVSGYGVFDMTGNVEEWVVTKTVKGKPRAAYAHVLKGCYWSGCYGGSKPTCTSTNAAHADTFKFYETGFRCCQDARVGAP
jgi:formylglycine-generating enzyme required for sulfatase activity